MQSSRIVIIHHSMMRNELLIGTLMNETINFRNIPDERVGKYGAKSASQPRFQIRATAKTRATGELRAERTVGAILWNEGITLAQVLDGPHVDMWLRQSLAITNASDGLRTSAVEKS